MKEKLLDYALAIRHNRDQLKAIVLALFVLARMRVGGSRSTLPRCTIALIMAVLRPAESAVRRLIVIVAQGLALTTSPLWGGRRVAAGGGREQSEQQNPVAPESRIRQFSSGSLLLATPTRQPPLCFGSATSPQGGGWAAKHRAFPLFDPLKSFDPDSIWDAEPAFESSYSLTKSTPWHDATTDQTPTDASHIALRLNAILRALNDLPRQARRLKRWELKRDAARRSLMLRCERSEPRSTQQWRPTRFSPMRPGLPPGWRERRFHEIDDVLKECHRLANDRMDSG